MKASTKLKLATVGIAMLASTSAFAQRTPGGPGPSNPGENCQTNGNCGDHGGQKQQQQQIINNPRQAPGIGGGIGVGGDCGVGGYIGATVPGGGGVAGLTVQDDRCHDRKVARDLATDGSDCLNRTVGRKTLGGISSRFDNAMNDPRIAQLVDASIQRCMDLYLVGAPNDNKAQQGYGARRPAAAAAPRTPRQ